MSSQMALWTKFPKAIIPCVSTNHRLPRYSTPKRLMEFEAQMPTPQSHRNQANQGKPKKAKSQPFNLSIHIALINHGDSSIPPAHKNLPFGRVANRCLHLSRKHSLLIHLPEVSLQNNRPILYSCQVSYQDNWHLFHIRQ